MVSVLLSRLLLARRVDGSGGDEGRDCYFTDESGTDAFELKSFTGRMTKARRQQVKRSLDRAMKSRPRTWTLIAPINPRRTSSAGSTPSARTSQRRSDGSAGPG